MFIKRFTNIIFSFIAIYSSLVAINANAEDIMSASVNGKYSNLIQQLNCPSDQLRYGEFSDYGYWAGGTWCGQIGEAGYWVWVFPNWYVWQNQKSSSTSANGKYSNLIQRLNCPADKSRYGEFSDYGYWAGGAWCGQTGEPGYWVWVSPNWYVWQNQKPSSPSVNGKYSNLIQKLNCPADKSRYGEFSDYGYWAGGPWCGQTGEAGYWVWVYPDWYVWSELLAPN